MADTVRKDDEIFGGIEQLSRSEQNVRESRIQQTSPGTARTVANSDGVLSYAGAVCFQSANGAVVHVQFRQRFAAAKLKILDDVIAFDGRGVIAGRGCRCRCLGESVTKREQ